MIADNSQRQVHIYSPAGERGLGLAFFVLFIFHEARNLASILGA